MNSPSQTKEFIQDEQIAEPSCEICHSRAIKLSFHKQGYDYYHCPFCSHLQILPLPSAEDLEAEYAHGFGASQEAQDDFKILEFAKHATGEFPLETFEQLQLPKDSHVLDIGCSFGYDLFAFRKHLGCENIYGIDLSSHARRIAHRVLKVPVFRDIDELMLQHIKFDFVFMKHNLEHHRHPSQTLEKIRGILKPGAHLLVGIPNRKSINGLWGKRWEWITPPIHIHFFSRQSLSMTLEKEGFQIEEFYSQRGHGMPFLKHLIFFTPVLGQKARQFLGNPYDVNSAKLTHLRQKVETWANRTSQITSPFSSLLKSRFLIGEELWVLAKYKG